MSGIPSNALTQVEFNEWAATVQQLGKLKGKEILLRMKVFGANFPAPTEGTQSVPLSEGFILQCKYPIGRKVLPDMLAAKTKELKEAGIKLGDLIVNKPELALRDYCKLTGAHLKLFDQILEIKPGTPQLAIVLPKNAKAGNGGDDIDNNE